jgi:starch synthase
MNADVRRPIRILFAAAEAVPFVKVGGLADVTGSLPAALNALPVDVWRGFSPDIRLVIPFHPVIPRDWPGLHLEINFSVPHPQGAIQAQAYCTDWNGVPVYLIAGEPVPTEGSVYNIDTQKDGEKFTFFSLAVLELCVALNWQPDILHAHDWHAALTIHMLRRRRQKESFFAATRGMFTVHNLPYMGAGTDKALTAYHIPKSNDRRLPPWGRFQPLPMGLAAADFITAVSPTYSREIMTPEFGCGLESFLQARAGSVAGVLNGLDLVANDPATHPAITQNFSLENLDIRVANKLALQKEFSLKVDPDIPLIILISRFDFQKGIDLAVNALVDLPDANWQAILLGSGDPVIEATARQMESDLADRLRVAVRYDAALSQRMYAGGDMLLIPSRYEPCGLTQMLAMRYGCIPVARATGGLRDTILDISDPQLSTGFLFEGATSESLAAAIRRALASYEDKTAWIERQRTAMRQDFSWNRSAQTYANLYFNMLGKASSPRRSES